MYPLWQRGGVATSSGGKGISSLTGGSSGDITTDSGGHVGSSGGGHFGSGSHVGSNDSSGHFGSGSKYRRMAASVGDMSYPNSSLTNGSYGNGNGNTNSNGFSSGSWRKDSDPTRRRFPIKTSSIATNGGGATSGKTSLFNNSIPTTGGTGGGSSLFNNSNNSGYNTTNSNSIFNCSNSNNKPTSSLNQSKNSLWNRRRTNSTTNLPSSVFGGEAAEGGAPTAKVFFTNTGSPLDEGGGGADNKTRGSSASPRTPHSQSRGFWLQHPEDLHQQWVKTDTSGGNTTDLQSTLATTCPTVSTAAAEAGTMFPFSEIGTINSPITCHTASSVLGPDTATLYPFSEPAISSNSPLTWPRRTSLSTAAAAIGGCVGPLSLLDQQQQPRDNSRVNSNNRIPAVTDPSAVLPRVYKSQATWMSTDGGGGDNGGNNGGNNGGDPADAGDSVMDFKHRIKRFQHQQQQQQQQQQQPDSTPAAAYSQNNGRNGNEQQTSTQENQPLVKQSQQQLLSAQQQQQLQQHSVSTSNLSKLKSSMSEMKSSIDEITSASNSLYSSSNLQQASSSSQSKIQSSSQSKIKSSSQSALSSSKSQSLASSTALKSSSSSSRTSSSSALKSVKSSKSTNALQSSFGLGSSENLAGFNLDKDQFDQSQLMEFKDPGELLLQDTSNLLNNQQPLVEQFGSNGSLNGGVTTFEQKKVTSSSNRKVTTDNNSFETATGSSSQSTRVQAGDVTYSECQQQAAARSKMEVNGVTEEKEAALQQEARQLKAGDDITHTEGSQKMGASVKVTGPDFSSQKSAVSESQKRQTVTPAGTISEEKSRKQSKSGLTITTKGVCTKQSTSMTSSESNISISGFEDFDISGKMQPMDIQNAIMKYSGVMTKFVDQLKSMEPESFTKAPNLLDHMNDMMKRAWSVPTYGHELGYSLCKVLKHNGGLDILLENCTSDDSNLKFSSAKVLEQCLTTENRGYVVEKSLESVVNVACDCTQDNGNVDQSRVGTGLLEHLFKHSEGTCSDIIKMGGLEAVVRECRKNDVETLRHCAGALANLSLYGGAENQQAMVQRQVAIWLFPLAFHHDDNIKYYACLAIAALVANTEIEAQVLKADTLSLIEPFVNSHLPEEFANSTVAHRHGQSRDWLEKLVPVLSSKRDEARNLAAFHFCMEAGIKKNQGNLDIFREINAIDPLKQVASSPNATASKYAAHALRLMGEEVPHKLSQQVPLWQANDVQEWVKQIGFSEYAEAFVASRVDGDLLLQIVDDNLRYDIGITNGILRQRFLRELRKLRQIADYSSKDSTGLNAFMTQLGAEYAEYTYRMLLAGANRNTLRNLTEDQLVTECGIHNSIHRQRVRDGTIDDSNSLQDSNQSDKNLDVFISYRRSNGSQLASLLKVHMQLKGFSVFIDVERLEAGKFDNNLLNSIRQARNFLLVLTPNALDRCAGDSECKDWVHKEIVAALESNCNIIPIIDNFQWPDSDQLPEDMRAVSYFNGVRWIHDYQDACVDKLERFMRGEGNLRGEPPGSLGRYQSTSVLTQPGTPSPLPRTQHTYQRTTSTESGKGSSCSDKEYTKDYSNKE